MSKGEILYKIAALQLAQDCTSNPARLRALDSQIQELKKQLGGKS